MKEEEILRSLLNKANVSLAEASELSNIPQPRFSEWLNGKRVPKWSTLNEIAKSLGIKINLVIK